MFNVILTCIFLSSSTFFSVASPVNMATSEFDLKYLADSLEKCKQEDGTLLMDDYLDAYDQISKFLRLLGSIFTFVVSDVNDKIQILREYRLGPDADQYITIDMMMAHEIQHQLTKKSKPSGSRTLLRLHRAFEFVMDFIREMRFATDDARMSDLTKTSYDRTLAKFHPWLVRQGVYIAAYTLPRISQFSIKMQNKDADSHSHMDRVLLFSKPIYDTVQELYIRNQLDDLP